MTPPAHRAGDDSAHRVTLAGALRRALFWLTGARFRVLLYHSISSDQLDPFAVPPHLLEEQLAALTRSGHRLVSLGQAVEDWRAGRDLRRVIAVTFDDALDDFLSAGLPILRSLGICATLFAPKGALGQAASWQTVREARRVLTAEELRSVRNHGVEIGAHGYRHLRLPELPAGLLAGELHQAHSRLRSLGTPAPLGFAYPYGDASPRERRAVRDAGFDYAVLAGGLWGNGAASDPWALTRILVTWRMTAEGIVHAVGRRGDLVRLWRHATSPRAPL